MSTELELIQVDDFLLEPYSAAGEIQELLTEARHYMRQGNRRAADWRMERALLLIARKAKRREVNP